jgi:hypothetical protein
MLSTFAGEKKRKKKSVEETSEFRKDNVTTVLESFLGEKKWQKIFKCDQFFVQTRYSTLMLFISGCFRDLSSLIYDGRGVIDVFEEICLVDGAFREKLRGMDVKAIYSDSLLLLLRDIQKKMLTLTGIIRKEESKETSVMKEFIDAHLNFLECEQVILIANKNYKEEMEKYIEPLRNVGNYIGEFDVKTLNLQRVCFHAALNFEVSNPRPQREEEKRYLFLNLKKRHLFFVDLKEKELKDMDKAAMGQCLNWVRGCMLDGHQKEASALMQGKGDALKWVADNFANYEVEDKDLKRKLSFVFHPDRVTVDEWKCVMTYLFRRCQTYDYRRRLRQDGQELEKALKEFSVPGSELEKWKKEQQVYINEMFERYKKGERNTVNLYTEALIVCDDDVNEGREVEFDSDESEPFSIDGKEEEEEDFPCLKPFSISVKPTVQPQETETVEPKFKRRRKLPTRKLASELPVKFDSCKKGTPPDSLFVREGVAGVVEQKEEEAVESECKGMELACRIIVAKRAVVELDYNEKCTTLIKVPEVGR